MQRQQKTVQVVTSEKEKPGGTSSTTSAHTSRGVWHRHNLLNAYGGGSGVFSDIDDIPPEKISVLLHVDPFLGFQVRCHILMIKHHTFFMITGGGSFD